MSKDGEPKSIAPAEHTTSLIERGVALDSEVVASRNNLQSMESGFVNTSQLSLNNADAAIGRETGISKPSGPGQIIAEWKTAKDQIDYNLEGLEELSQELKCDPEVYKREIKEALERLAQSSDRQALADNQILANHLFQTLTGNPNMTIPQIEKLRTRIFSALANPKIFTGSTGAGGSPTALSQTFAREIVSVKTSITTAGKPAIEAEKNLLRETEQKSREFVQGVLDPLSAIALQRLR